MGIKGEESEIEMLMCSAEIGEGKWGGSEERSKEEGGD